MCKRVECPLRNMDRYVEPLTVGEQNLKPCCDLHQIFSQYGQNGLTWNEIYDYIRKLGLRGYDSFAPDAVIRSAIYRWNRFAKGTRSHDRICWDKKERPTVYYLREDYKRLKLRKISQRIAARKILRFIKNRIGNQTMEEFLWKPENGRMSKVVCEHLADMTDQTQQTQQTVRRAAFHKANERMHAWIRGINHD